MIITTLEQEVAVQEELVEASREEVVRLREELRELRAQIERNGEADKDTGAEVKRLGGMIKHCLDTEKTLAECKQRQVGIAQCGFAFDLNAAKCSIGRKLDRLRACQPTE